MSISREQIAQVTKLARLNLSEEDLNKYSAELGKIFDYVERLSKVNTEGVEPLIHSSVVSTPTRADIVDQSAKLQDFRESFLEIAPQTEGRFFKVPKMGE